MGYTRRQAVLAALVANAIKPVRGPITVVPVFFASWLTSELAPHILVAQALDTLRSLRRREATVTGLALGALSAIGLGWMVKRSNDVAGQVDTLLRNELEIPEDVEARTRLRTYARPFKYADRGVRVLRDIAYTEGGRRAKLDIYLPAEGGVEKAPVLIQIHGGAWMISHKGQQGLLLMNQMAARGWVCVAANYRLAPTHRWPTQIVDVKRAIAWVRENIAEYGGDPDYLILTGGSAGGHLSALATVTPSDPAWQPGFEDAETSVSGCVPFYGIYDFDSDDAYAKPMRDFLTRVVFPRDTTLEDFRNASALHRLTDDVPEFLVVHGANDSLANVEQARSFVARLRQINPGKVTYLELPGTQHAFEVFGSVRARHVT
ncbi:MAG TPA: alpha/beta hydrolase, partial [Aeromicrobium sp.]|nr:alpha/beta hydrolase [Aeromicrobium sp.]